MDEQSATPEPYVTDTDAAGMYFGTRDTRDHTWLDWGRASRAEADKITDHANRVSRRTA